MKRTIALMVSGLLAFSLVACGQAPQAPAGNDPTDSTESEDLGGEDEFVLPPIPDDLTGGKPWMDSNVVGNVTADTKTSPTDDFCLYVNKDQLLSQKLPEGSPTLERDHLVEARAHVKAALLGEDLTDHDAHQAQLLAKAFCNTDARDTVACDPARQVIDDIRSLKSVDELSAFLLDTQRSAGVPTLVMAINSRNWTACRWETDIKLSPATFGNTMGTMGEDATTMSPDDPIYQARFALVRNVLTRAGYSEEEAKAAFENRLNLEKQLIQIASEAQDDSPVLALEQLDGLAGTFPLRALVEARGYGQATEFHVRSTADLEAAAALYTDEHLAELRDYLICGYVIEAGSWLDTEAYDAWIADYSANGYQISLTAPERNTTIEDTATNLAAEVLPTPVGRAYVEAYDLAHTKEVVEALGRDAIEAHKEIVNASKWLSDTSKQRLCEKLDAVTMQVVYPDAWEDYSGLNLEGLTYYEARKAIWLNDLALNAAKTDTDLDTRLWEDPSLMSIAAYDSATNSFNVGGGACEVDVARYEAGEITFEEFMGSVTGYSVFHELGHALDTVNIKVDKTGADLEGSLLEPADYEEFQRRTNKIVTYFDGISIWEGQQVQGSICANEALAEICSMQARLSYAAKHEGFDYKTFFETRAGLGATLNTPEYELQCVLGADLHPSFYLDINVTFQQFDEFLEAYGVKEDDGMWLAPEDRLVMW